jgi:hypothetical protein
MIIDQLLKPRASGFDKIKGLFSDKTGIEIGGPSNMFKPTGLMPLYTLAKQVDGCNFSNYTQWSGQIEEGNNTYGYVKGKFGHQYICDGVDVPIIPKHSYDFILSCNNLEHIANPLKAVSNWIKLLKPTGGALVLVLPRKESNFDHRRPTTTFSHLLNDFENNIGEDDLTVMEEVFQLHDLSLDPLAGGLENFKKRSLDNINNRCLHHHVFDLALMEEICTYFKLDVVLKESRVKDHIIVATTGMVG